MLHVLGWRRLPVAGGPFSTVDSCTVLLPRRELARLNVSHLVVLLVKKL